MHQIRLKVPGVLSFALTRNAGQLIFTPTRAAWPPGLEPVLHGGARADHLSIPCQPRLHGPDAGTFWIHVTYEDGHHVPIAKPTPKDVHEFFDGFSSLMLDKFRADAFRVTPEKLEECGFAIMLLRSETSERIVAAIQNPRREYEVGKDPFTRPEEAGELHSPLMLREIRTGLKLLRPFIPAIHADGSSLHLAYYDDWFDGEGPGWIAVPQPLITEDLYLAAVAKLAGPAPWRALLVAARELQAACNRERLTHLAELPEFW